MAEITLGDLLTWEPRLRLATPPRLDGTGAMAHLAPEERELSWAVAVRATPPMLPALRGGELVLLPHRILRESGIGIGPLLRELAGHGVAAVVMEAETTPPGLRAGAPLPILILSVGPLTADVESDLNRVLTQRRGELYRAGTEFGRLLASLTTAGAEPSRIVAATVEALGVPVELVDAEGQRLVAAGHRENSTDAGTGGQAPLLIPLVGGETLRLGPLVPERRALVRLVGERLGVALESALTRSTRDRPRGAARAAALASFLLSHPDDSPDHAARAAALGLSPGATYRVALAAPGLGEGSSQRLVSALGPIHDAGTIDGMAAAILDARGQSSGGGRMVPPLFGGGEIAGSPPAATAWLAVSGPGAGVAGLSGALREARFVAALLSAGLIRGPLARFDALPDLGVYRLLFAHWGGKDLRAFASEALGGLPERDRRGVLRQTLLAYFETGGSHVEAAARLAVHRNTLAYRLKQVASLTGADPAEPSNRLLLHLGLLAAALPPAPE